eukprot:6474110-Amphidinium_carterae.1
MSTSFSESGLVSLVGHHAIAELEKLIQGDYLLVTQNVDGLHRSAGSDPKHICELHGRIDEMRCDERLEGACLYEMDLNDPANLAKARKTVKKTPQPAKNEAYERLPVCAECGKRQRPKILWFDESYNEAFFKWKTVISRVEECDVLLIIGTQLTTGGPQSMVRNARESGAIIIRVDPSVDLADTSTAGMLHVEGKSGECLPRIVNELKMLQKQPKLAPLTASSKLDAVAAGAALPQRGEGAEPAGARRAASKAAASGHAERRSGSKVALRAAGSATLGRSASSTKPSVGKGSAIFSTVDAAPVGLFVCGTLRPDDDSGAPSTKAFNEGLQAEVAYLPGASLYVEGGQSPLLCLEETRCSVRGVLLTPAEGSSGSAALLASKLAEADEIQGYPDSCRRTVSAVSLASGQVRRAYVYHSNGSPDRAHCVCIPDGDWLSRKRIPKEEAKGVVAATR